MRNTLTALLAAAVLATLPSPTTAQPRALAMLGAHHADAYTHCDNAPPARLQSFTPGVGIAYDFGPSVMAAAGVWRTSQDNWTGFAIADWRPLRYRDVSAGVFAGVSGGYCLYENRYGPIGGFTVRADINRFALHLMYVPEFGSEKNTATVGAAVTYAFNWEEVI